MERGGRLVSEGMESQGMPLATRLRPVEPHPIAVLLGDDFRDVRFPGWRYLLEGGGRVVGSVEISEGDARPTLTFGPRGEESCELLERARNALGSTDTRSLSIAFLRIPERHFTGMWVRRRGAADGDEGIVLPLPPVPKWWPVDEAFVPERDFAAILPTHSLR